MAQLIEKFNEEYRQMVARYIRDNDPTVFHNETIANAKDITIQFLNAAQNSVEIMTGAMAEVFYNDERIKEAFVNAARRLPQNAIRIFTVNSPGDEVLRIQKSIEEINESAGKARGNASIVYRPARYDGNPETLRHFMLVDDKRYRWEFPHERFIGKLKDVSATVCCFDRVTVKERKDFFNSVWKVIGA